MYDKRTYQLSLTIPSFWVKDAEELKALLNEECNIWSVTHCDADLQVKEVTENVR